MTLNCLRCDWKGETEEAACPNCGGEALYTVPISPAAEAATPARNQLEEPAPKTADAPDTAVSDPSPLEANPPTSPEEVLEPSSRPARPVVAFVLAGVALTVILGSWLKAQEDRSAPPASKGAAAGETPAITDSAAPAAPPRPGAVVRIYGATGRIAGRVVVPSPKLLASDGRSVLVFTEGGTTRTALVVFDATKADAFRDYGVADALSATNDGEAAVSSLAAAGGRAWLGSDTGGLYRLAAGGDAVGRADRDVPALDNLEPDSLVGAAGSLWMSWFPAGPCCVFPPDLYRVDPATGRVTARIDDATRVVASGAGFVWAVVNPQEAEPRIVRIDTRTNKAAMIGTLEHPWADLVAAGGAVWASSPKDQTIARLDPVTGEEIERVRVGGEPGPLAAGGGALWAVIGTDGTIERHDLRTGEVRTINVGGTPGDLVFAHGSVWVTVLESTEAGAGAETQPLSFVVPIGRQSLTVDGIPLSFSVRTAGWEGYGGVLMSKSEFGPQGAEGVIFWAGFPDGRYAVPCAPLDDPSIVSAEGVAAAVATAPGTEPLVGRADVVVGGRDATRVVVGVRENVGCDPGFFYRWKAQTGGAMWSAGPRDTIRVWIVKVHGKLLFIGAETHQDATRSLDREIEQIVDSIRFD
jgi:hypothetical protein